MRQLGDDLPVAIRRRARRDLVAPRITLACEVPDDLPLLCADRHRMSQILSNLVTNAIKFTPRGGTATITAAGLASAWRSWNCW